MMAKVSSHHFFMRFSIVSSALFLHALSSVPAAFAADNQPRTDGRYLGGTGTPVDPARIEMTIERDAPKPLDIRKDGDQYQKDIGNDGYHVFGEGDKQGGAVGFGKKF